MILSSVAERLNEPIGRVVTTLAAATEGTEWDFMTEGSSDTGVFSSLISKLQDIGASGYQLMMTLGIIGLVFSIIFTAVSLLLTPAVLTWRAENSCPKPVAPLGSITYTT